MRQKSRFAKRFGYLEGNYTAQFRWQAFWKGGWHKSREVLLSAAGNEDGAHGSPEVVWEAARLSQSGFPGRQIVPKIVPIFDEIL